MNDEEITDSTPESIAEELGRMEEEPSVNVSPAMPPPTNQRRVNPSQASAVRRDQLKTELFNGIPVGTTRRSNRNRNNRS